MYSKTESGKRRPEGISHSPRISVFTCSIFISRGGRKRTNFDSPNTLRARRTMAAGSSAGQCLIRILTRTFATRPRRLGILLGRTFSRGLRDVRHAIRRKQLLHKLLVIPHGFERR